MSTCVLQVVAPPGAGPGEAAEDKDRWHVLVIDLVQSAHSNSLAHAERLVDMTWIRTWAPTATRSPYLGCGMICDPTALSRDPTAHRHGRNPHGLAETLGKLGFDGRAPQYKIEQDGPKAVHTTRYDSHTLLHRLLKEDRLHISPARRRGPRVADYGVPPAAGQWRRRGSAHPVAHQVGRARIERGRAPVRLLGDLQGLTVDRVPIVVMLR